MKVLLLSNVFPPGFIGGYELGALEIANHLTTSGHEVNVLTSDFFQDERKLITGFAVDRILECCELSHERPTPPSSELEGVFCNWRNLRRIARIIRRDVPDLVLSFNLSGLGQVAIYQFLAACNVGRLSYFMDSCFQAVAQFPGPWKEYERIFGPLRAGDLGRVIVMSRNLLGELSSTVKGLCSSNVAFVPGWVDPALATPCMMKPPKRSCRLRRFVFAGVWLLIKESI